jgi:hypothetical protein
MSTAFRTAQQLHVMMTHGQLPVEMDDVVSDFHKIFNSDERGTLLSDIKAFTRPLSHDPPRGKASLHDLGPIDYKLLKEWATRNSVALDSSRYGTAHESLVLRGVRYESQMAKLESSSQRIIPESHIAFGASVPHEWKAGRIEKIFVHSEETFLLIRPFKELDDLDSRHDHYRRFPIAGGRVYYQSMDPTIVIHRADIRAHIAYVPSVCEQISSAHFLALPLDRVRYYDHCPENPLTEVDFQE